MRPSFDENEKKQEPTPPDSPGPQGGKEDSAGDAAPKVSQDVADKSKATEVPLGSIEPKDDANMSSAGEDPGKNTGDDESAEEKVKRIQDRMDKLEKKLRDFEEDYLEGTAASDSDEPKSAREKVSAIPELRRVDWQNFKNKLSSDTKPYAVEVLVGEAKYYHQREDEERKSKLRGEDTKSGATNVTQKSSKPADEDLHGIGELPERIRINSKSIISILGQIDSANMWNETPMVMLRPFKPLVYYDNQLRETFRRLEAQWGEAENAAVEDRSTKDSAAEGADGAIKPRTKESGGESNADVAATDPPAEKAEVTDPPPEVSPASEDKSTDAKTTTADNKPEDEKEAGEKEEPEDLSNSLEALRDLRCLIQFMDEDLQPVVDRYSTNDCKTAPFSDMWFIFKPGDYVYVPLGPKSPSDVAVDITGKLWSIKPQDRIQDVYRVMSTADGRPNLRGKNPELDSDNISNATKVNSFTIIAYYVDYNGSKFGSLGLQFILKAYQGHRAITSLPFYPLRFAPNCEELKSKWIARGRSFLEFMTPKHKYFVGKSLIHRPSGIRAEGDNFPKHAENIDSEVVVDFFEAISTNPGWSPSPFAGAIMMNVLNREFKEDYPVSFWKDRDRKTLDYLKEDAIYFDRRIDRLMMEVGAEKDGLAKDVPDKSLEDDGKLGDEHLMLLPNRAFAFVMKNRKFGKPLLYSISHSNTLISQLALVTVEGLRDVKTHVDGFNDLKLRPGHKSMVSSLVHNHFANKAAEANDRDASHDSDLVRGKGKGLIVLLHGAPGVGKTSTAECIAEAYGKPLFPVTCGDLGLTAAEVEKELHEKFHLAELWDCVLLLDEADVFLAQRTRTDLKRNSLVSVFLRVLEYFTGILFLTTNRVGAFDEAFKSRIHMSLYYPPLDWTQSKSIWEVNVKRLKAKRARRNEQMKIDEDRLFGYAKQHFDDNVIKKTQWNGRQIRNAFQTATALAEYEAFQALKDAGPEAERMVPELMVKHFDIVATASSEFDKYLFELRGITDSHRAWMDNERADQYKSNKRPMPRREQQPPPGYGGPAPMQIPQGQKGGGYQQRYSRPQSYVDNRQRYMDSSHMTFQEGELEEEMEDPRYGQTWQDARSLWPAAQLDPPDSEQMFQRQRSPERQQGRGQPSMRRGSYYGYNDGPEDFLRE